MRLQLVALGVLFVGCGRQASLPDASSFTEVADAGVASGFALSDAGEWLFFLAPLGMSSTDIDGLDVNAAGEVYGSGFVEGGAQFSDLDGDGVRRDVGVSASTGKDLLLFKLSPSGGARWLQLIPSTGNEGNGYDLAVDAVEDSVYTSGSFSGALNLAAPWQLNSGCAQGGSGKSNAYGQVMLLKHDRDGRVVWALQSTSIAAAAGGNEVALDGARDVIESGTFGPEPGCGAGVPSLVLGGATVPSDGDADAFAAVFAHEDGALRAGPVHVGGSGFQRAQAVVTGTRAGLTPESLVLGVSYKGPTVLHSRTRGDVALSTSADPNDWDLVVAKYDYEGELVWHWSVGSSQVLVARGTLVQEQLKGVGLDSQGDVLVSGTLTGSVQIAGVTYAPDSLSAGAVSMGFLAKLRGVDGTVAWFRTFTSEQGINTCCELTVGADDVVAMSPQVYGSSLFFSTGQAPFVLRAGGTDKLGALLRFDSAGQALDARNLAALQTAGTTSTTSELAVHAPGVVTFTGTLDGELLAPVNWSTGGQSNEFVARFRY